MSDIIWEKCAPNPLPQKRGREYAFSSLTSIILKLTYFGRGLSDFDEIWPDDTVRPS